MWIYVLAPWTVDPGLTMMFNFLGRPDIAEALVSTIDTPFGPFAIWFFVIATVVNIIALLFVVFGMKIFAMAQKIIMAVGIVGCLAIILVFTFTSHDAFVQAWNNLATQYGSLDYNSFLSATITEVEAQGMTLPITWNWSDSLGVMVAGSWLFAYSYCITFIAGEVKRPDKTIILANLSAILVPGFFMTWLAIVLYKSVGFQFLSATAFVDYNLEGALAGYTIPWLPNFVGLAAMVVPTNTIILFLMALSFIVFNLWWVALSYLAFPRILFAWGMDRMGPKWFADIDYKYASPVKNHILCFVLGEIGIFIYVIFQDQLSALSVTGLEIVTVFGVTAIAAAIFPFSKRARQIWDASPYKRWKIGPIPVVTIAGIVNMIYLGILFYYFLILGVETTISEFVKNSLWFYVLIWVLGIAWYFYWKNRNKQVGVDVSMTFGELPPD
jgi:amino acid transporter